MTERRITLGDVARAAGVSRTTASFVLAGRTDMRISPATQERVVAVATEMGYRYNVTARSLRTRKTQTLGFVSDTIATTPFAGEAVRGALDAARKRGHLLFVAETGGDPQTEIDLVNGMLDRGVDGVIYASMYTREVTPPPQLAGRPVALLNCLAPGFEAPSVVPDEAQAGRDAAQLLLDAGHTEGIYAIGGRHALPSTPNGVFAGNERLAGLREVLGGAGVRLADLVECEWAVEDGYREVSELLLAGARPQALVCANDRLAFGVYQALAEGGLRVGSDVSVVSFDDQDLASWLRPGLTTLAIPHYNLGQVAVELVCAPRPGDAKSHRLPMPVRQRESVRGGAPSPEGDTAAD
ncbi:LacI family DNA-binding transcriptional regulator [Streptomyces sp. NPDC086835]|uniref:LacI family DNA-binding transcriptional regulator n=1 Tax=Streptomyces sp. NPDC086835 TaxID=3365761 RepID=UPI0037FC4D2F